MYTLYLAFRYMIKRITAYLAVISFALGVAVLIIVTSVMSGFAKNMKEKIRGTTSHVVVQKGLGKFICDYESLLKKIRNVDHVVAVSPRIKWLVMYTQKGFQGESRMRAGFLMGVDPEREARTTRLDEYVGSGEIQFSYRNGSPRYPGVLMGLPPGRGLSPGYDPKPLRPVVFRMTSRKLSGKEQNVQGEFEKVGSYSSGMYNFDQRHLYCSLSAAQEFLHQDGCITQMAVRVDDYDSDVVLKQVVSDIAEILSESERRGFNRDSIKTWKEQRAGLLQAVKAERGLTTILLFLVVVVAGFMLLAVLSLMVLEKRRDIGIIRSLGGTVKGVAGIFLTEGLIIGLIGSGIGVLLGYLVVMNLNPIANVIEDWTGWHPFPEDVYILEEIPAIWNPETAFLIVAVTIAMSFLFSIIPAIRAARMEPVEAIRHE